MPALARRLLTTLNLPGWVVRTPQTTRAGRFSNLRDAGFDNVSFDLIAGLPGQSLDGWVRNLDEAFAMRPEHLSFYLLEVHQGTPLAEHIRRGLQPQPDEDLATEMYEVMLDRAAESRLRSLRNFQLESAGF